MPLLRKEILGPGGEPIEKFKKRVEEFIESIKNKNYKSILVVSHMAVLQVIKGEINHLNINEMRKQKVDHTEVIEQDLTKS